MSVQLQGEVRIDRPRADVAVFELAGEFDMASAPDLEATLNEAVKEGCGIVADLSQTQFMDSSAIRVLHNVRAALAAQGKQLAVRINTASVVMRVLEITAFATVVPIRSDLDAAIAIAAGSPETSDGASNVQGQA